MATATTRHAPPIEVRVDQADGLETAASVFLPEVVPERPLVVFAFPGGGGTRHSYFLSFDGHADYSEAAYFAGHGAVFVACDHLGVGDSTPLPELPITWARASAANQRTTTAILERMASGTLADGVAPLTPGLVVGTGQSMGGMLMIHQQGTYRTFGAVSITGASAVQTRPPTLTDGRDQASQWAYFGEEDPDVVAALTAQQRAPVILTGEEMMSVGPVAEEAAGIDVPVYVSVGELDCVADIRAEPAAYPLSPHVTVTVIPRTGHRYQISPNRHLVWARKLAWAQSILTAWV